MTKWGILSKVNDYEKVERLPFRWKINCLQEQQYSFIFQQKSKIKTITACCFTLSVKETSVQCSPYSVKNIIETLCNMYC